MAKPRNGPLSFGQVGRKLHRLFEMHPTDSPTLAGRLVAQTHLSSWLLASLAIGIVLYLLFLILAFLSAGSAWLISDGNWRSYNLLTPVLVSYLLLFRPLVRRLLLNAIETAKPLLSIPDTPTKLVAEAFSFNHGFEWLSFGLGVAAGWLIVRPWQYRPLGIWFLAYNLLADGLMFGLLGWTIYSG
jgi:hypothetical protein